MEIQDYQRYEPIFGCWKIVRQIGEGSFGKVFEIQREDFGVTYKAALKAITVPANQSELQEAKADGLDDVSVRTYFGSFVEDLVKEFALMSKLKGNSNIVSYENHQVIEHKDGIGWDILIQMELLTPLNQYLSAHTMMEQDVIKLGIDLCKALELCQKYNIIHRDIKPENIFISDIGDFKLGDFGIARTVEKTTSGLSQKGTYTYMAPEVYKGKPYGSTVDIYSLGLVLYRLLNGNRTPFLPAAPAPITYADRENALSKRFSGALLPPPANTQGWLSKIVLKACAYDPGKRYSKPEQMRQDLEAVLAGKELLFLEEPPEFILKEEPIRFIRREPAADHVENDQLEKTTGIFESSRKPQDSKESDARETDHSPNPWNSLEKEAVDSAVPKKSPKSWILPAAAGGFIVICMGVTGLFLLGDEPLPAANTGSSISSSIADTAQTVDASDQTAPDDYLETVRDSEGRIIREPRYEWDGSVTYIVDEYDAQGNNVKTSTYNLLGELESAMQREFDSDGNCIRINYYDGFGNLESYIQQTYQNGEWVRSDTYDPNGQMTGYTLMEGPRSSYYTPDGTLKYAYEYEYDAQENPLKTSHFNEDGVLSQYTLSEYGEDGQLTAEETYYADGRKIRREEYDSFRRRIREIDYYSSGAVFSTTEYEYDDGGFRSREKQFDHKGQLTRTIDYTYNQRGEKAGASWYDGQGVLQSAYEYGGNGQIAKESDYEEGNLERYSLYEYDEQEKLTRKNRFDPDGTLRGYATYQYGPEGNLAVESEFSGEGRLSVVTEYNSEGRTSKRTNYDSDGNLESYWEHEYDETGKNIKSSWYQADGSLKQYTVYEYDDQGNEGKISDYNGDDTLESYQTKEYNQWGECIKLSFYNGDGSLDQYVVYEYDADGVPLGTTWYNPDGTKQE